MKKTIRMLNIEDYTHLEAMNTGIEDDYIKHIFSRLISGYNRLYGLFIDGQMISMGGHSIYAKRYAMLGRLRTDHQFKKNDYATALMSYMMDEAFKIEGIQWIGANTQESNAAAKRVMEKIGMVSQSVLHGAVTKDTSTLESGSHVWKQLTDLQRKKEWLNKMYVQSSSPFPYECYYVFPGSSDLFQEQDLEKWSFHENEAQNRFLITKKDSKKHHYLHAIYPWNDITSQHGLWETISSEYQKLKMQTEGETYIWMDLTKEEAGLLPGDHQFELPSPWVLYGIERTKYQKLTRSRQNKL
ncbi:GNAT family N-acetyltransferase [Virgibacillus sp. C22-A2]|uniref:GNAT family N-acetyltransferase n=1 Tax=Virgibacillus tibetensis TaxID=3042313 RepID=A0ABU6KHZ5_9BACI|nr:GNAT family N-acetyltransferase [Virgibacillus sp. C22-A2]